MPPSGSSRSCPRSRRRATRKPCSRPIPSSAARAGPSRSRPGSASASNVLCPGKDRVFEVLDGVLDEILDIFPSEVIHIGGDETPRARWKKCPDCQARIAAEGLPDIPRAPDLFHEPGRRHAPGQGTVTHGLERGAKREPRSRRHRAVLEGWDEADAPSRQEGPQVRDVRVSARVHRPRLRPSPAAYCLQLRPHPERPACRISPKHPRHRGAAVDGVGTEQRRLSGSYFRGSFPSRRSDGPRKSARTSPRSQVARRRSSTGWPRWAMQSAPLYKAERSRFILPAGFIRMIVSEPRVPGDVPREKK